MLMLMLMAEKAQWNGGLILPYRFALVRHFEKLFALWMLPKQLNIKNQPEGIKSAQKVARYLFSGRCSQRTLILKTCQSYKFGLKLSKEPAERTSLGLKLFEKYFFLLIFRKSVIPKTGRRIPKYSNIPVGMISFD